MSRSVHAVYKIVCSKAELVIELDRQSSLKSRATLFIV